MEIHPQIVLRLTTNHCKIHTRKSDAQMLENVSNMDPTKERPIQEIHIKGNPKYASALYETSV